MNDQASILEKIHKTINKNDEYFEIFKKIY